MLARLVTDRTSQQITTAEMAAAEQELDELYLANLGTSRALIHRLGTEDLLGVLRSAGSVHGERAYVLGALLSTEAAILAAHEGAASDAAYYLRAAALDILLEAGAARVGEPDLHDRISELASHVAPDEWPSERFGRLHRYEAERGSYTGAEDALFTWLERCSTTDERMQVGGAADDYYSMLESLEDDDLVKGGFSREEVTEGRADFAERMAELLSGEA